MKVELHQNSPKHRPVKIGLSRRKMARLKGAQHLALAARATNDAVRDWDVRRRAFPGLKA